MLIDTVGVGDRRGVPRGGGIDLLSGDEADCVCVVEAGDSPLPVTHGNNQDTPEVGCLSRGMLSQMLKK